MMKKRRFNRFAKRVYKVIHPEFKIHSDNVTGDAGIYDSNPYAFALTRITIGTLNTERNASKINIKSIKLRIAVRMNTENTADYNQYRILIVKNKFPENAGLSLLSNILDFDNSGDTHMNAYRNIAYYKNYKVMKDTNVKTLGTIGNLVPIHVWNWYFKVNSVTTYTANQGTDTDVSMNSYEVHIFADQGAHYPQVSMDYSVRYIDC